MSKKNDQEFLGFINSELHTLTVRCREIEEVILHLKEELAKAELDRAHLEGRRLAAEEIKARCLATHPQEASDG